MSDSVYMYTQIQITIKMSELVKMRTNFTSLTVQPEADVPASALANLAGDELRVSVFRKAAEGADHR